MKKLVSLCVAVALFSSLVIGSGCIPLGSNRTTVMGGGIYTGVGLPNNAPMEPAAEPTKTGTASCKSVLLLVSWGDCSVEAAMQEGNMTKVHHVDNEFQNILFFYMDTKTIAYGE